MSISLTALLIVLFMPAALIVAESYRIRHDTRGLVLAGGYLLLVANELLFVRYGEGFYFYHVLLDGLVFSMVAGVLAGVAARGSEQGGGLLFHRAFLYLTMFACLALVLVSPQRAQTLTLAVALVTGVFAVLVMVQQRGRDLHARLLILAAWLACHVAVYAQPPALNRALTLLFFGMLAALITLRVLLANRKVWLENRLLFRSRDVVLTMLNDVASSLESATSVDGTLRRVLRAVADTLGAEGAVLYTVQERQGHPTALVFSHSEGRFYPLSREDAAVLANYKLVEERLGKSSYLLGDGVVGSVAEHGKPILLNHPADYPRMVSYGMSTKHVHNVLAVPFSVKGKLYGVIAVENSTSAPAFTPDDANLLQSLADQAAVSVNHTSMYVELTQTARLRQEANIATRIQRQFLPTSVPTPPNLRIAAFMEPAKELGGDYYDFVPYEDGSMGIVIGDVSGKGVPAALMMAIAKAIVQLIGHQESDVREATLRFSREMYRNMQRGQFMTLNYLRWEGATRTLSFASAGHEHVLWFHSATGQTEALRAGGVAAGLMEEPGEHIKRQDLRLVKGDVIVLYTDGVTEARDPTTAMFGLRRLQSALDTYAYLRDPDQVRDHIMKEVNDFRAGAEQFDDITLLVLSVVS